MVPQLKEMIENQEISEIELIKFIKTLKILSKNDFMEKRNVRLVIEHFGFKKKKGWIKTEKGVKWKL